jgi:protein involved in polysaccharide export with SLBB domain
MPPPKNRCQVFMPGSNTCPGPAYMLLSTVFMVLMWSAAGSAQTTLRTPGFRNSECPDEDCSRQPAIVDTLSPLRSDQAQPTAPLPADETTGPAKKALPEIPDSEFQDFVTSSLGHRLPIYGYSLFDDVPSTFAPSQHVPVSDDYVIGPGDEILLRSWGQIEIEARLVVGRGGDVFLPRVGTLTVAGLRYQQLGDYFRTAVSRVFRNFDLTVSLGQLRSIEVLVVGQARRPGSYTISSLSSLVNALFASGGPSPSGSMRHIQLKRSDAVITDFDLYDLLLKGDKSKDRRLLPGDVIYIPAAGPRVALAGSVNVAAIYELRERTTLGAGIAMAGGLAAVADGQKALLERIENHSLRRVEEFPLDANGLQQPLQDGDLVRIFPLSPRFENAVMLRGNVAHPGRMPWHAGMRLRDLLPNQAALITRQYWSATNAESNPEVALSSDVDRQTDAKSLVTSSRSAARLAAGNTTAANAAESETGRSAEGKPETRLKTDITRNGVDINWDYAVIQRLDSQDLTPRLLPFNLGKLVLEGDEENNLALEPGDVVIIFSQDDVAVPLDKRASFLRLEGEFQTPGVFRAEPGETLRQLVARAGGFTSKAYLYGAEFTRESVRAEQQKALDQMIAKLEEDISRNALTTSGISAEEISERHARLEAQRQLVDKLRQVKATGRIVLDLQPDSAEVADLPEIALQDGDRLLVPALPSTVSILGAVYNRNSFLYRREETVGQYLKRAGGPTRDADQSRMFLVRADGSVLSKQSVSGLWHGGFPSLRLMPGDAIVVPERLSHASFMRGLKDWSQIFSQFALGAAAVRVIQ